MVDGEEIKLELFANNLTAFLLNDNSLLKFLELLKSFGECSGGVCVGGFRSPC